MENPEKNRESLQQTAQELTSQYFQSQIDSLEKKLQEAGDRTNEYREELACLENLLTRARVGDFHGKDEGSESVYDFIKTDLEQTEEIAPLGRSPLGKSVAFNEMMKLHQILGAIEATE